MLNPLVLVPVIIFFIIGFVLFRYILPKLGDWEYLAEKYKTDLDPKDGPVKKLQIRNCNIGGMGYQNAIKFYEAYNGLLLKPSWILKQSNLLIPWREIKHVQLKKNFFYKYVRLIIGDPFVSYIEISEKDYSKIKDRVEKYGH
ncbi:MAG: hypothetical protein AAFZ15_02660 [Bacteroidota bacterium]